MTRWEGGREGGSKEWREGEWVDCRLGFEMKVSSTGK